MQFFSPYLSPTTKTFHTILSLLLIFHLHHIISTLLISSLFSCSKKLKLTNKSWFCKLDFFFSFEYIFLSFFITFFIFYSALSILFIFFFFYSMSKFILRGVCTCSWSFIYEYFFNCSKFITPYWNIVSWYMYSFRVFFIFMRSALRY